MSLNVYSVEYPEQLAPGTFGSLLAQLPAVFQQKVLRYRRWQDAYGSLFGKLLLQLALRRGDHPGDLTALQYGAADKPYLEGGPAFNLSHSGNRVVCVLGRQERVGIDLEAISDLAIDDLRTQFTPSEWQRITGSTAPLTTFYRYWTAKESLIKADGRGLQIPLDELEVGDAVPEEGILIGGQRWFIREMEDFSGYACHIACERPPAQPELRIVTVDELSV